MSRANTIKTQLPQFSSVKKSRSPNRNNFHVKITLFEGNEKLENKVYSSNKGKLNVSERPSCLSETQIPYFVNKPQIF